jgi:hypothetical protein
MRLHRLRIAAVLAVLVVVAVLALTVSGGSDTQFVSGSAIAGAARATQKVPGATVTMDAKFDIDGLAKPMGMRLEGVMDTRGRSTRMAGSYVNVPQKVPGASPGGTIPIEVVSLAPDVYMKSPLFGSALPDGKTWLHVDFAAQGKKLGIGDPTQFGQSDPSETVSNLQATSDRVERVGKESVRGTPTTHYRAKIEMRKLPALVPAARRAAARQSIQKLIQLTGTDSYPIDVWVDQHQLVRRTRYTMDMKLPPQNQHMHVDITTEMYDFGPKPKAQRPPANETFEASKLSGASTP